MRPQPQEPGGFWYFPRRKEQALPHADVAISSGYLGSDFSPIFLLHSHPSRSSSAFYALLFPCFRSVLHGQSSLLARTPAVLVPRLKLPLVFSLSFEGFSIVGSNFRRNLPSFLPSRVSVADRVGPSWSSGAVDGQVLDLSPVCFFSSPSPLSKSSKGKGSD